MGQVEMTCVLTNKKKMRTQYHCNDSPANGAYCKPDHEETADKPRSRDIRQNNWSVPARILRS